MLIDVIAALWVGAFLGALMKMGSPHENWVSWLLAALVGAFGAVLGLFAARLLGVSREDDLRTLLVAGGHALIVMCGYASLSRVALRRLKRRTGRGARTTIAF